MQLEVLCPHGTFNAGLPAAEYEVSLVYTTGGYTCIPGEVRDGLFYSWYMGNFQEGISFTEAPLNTGKLRVSRSGDNYTITFEAYDDAPTLHLIIGKPTMKDNTQAAVESLSQHVKRALPGSSYLRTR